MFGAVDPSSGTSVMMEIARVLGETMKTGIGNLVGWLKKNINGEPYEYTSIWWILVIHQADEREVNEWNSYNETRYYLVSDSPYWFVLL